MLVLVGCSIVYKLFYKYLIFLYALFCCRTNFEATPPPILIDNGLAVLENEKIERHIMKNVPGGHNLFVQDKEVATLIENLYSVSSSVVKNYNTYIQYLCQIQLW